MEEGPTVLDVGGAEGLVSDMISWIASRSFSLCSGLLMPISRWISVSDRADMMAPLFTLARQAATYQAGIPTQSWGRGTRGGRLCVAAEGGTDTCGPGWGVGGGRGRSHTSSQTTTVGPSHCAKGKPCLRASSSNSCLQVRRHSKFKNHRYTRI